MMKHAFLQKAGGIAVIAGGILLAVYAICFFTVLPFKTLGTNFVGAVQHAAWIPIVFTAFVALILLIFGFAALYSHICEEAGWVGFIGFVLLEVAYMVQFAKVTWELCIYPIIAAHTTTAFLLAQKVIKDDPGVGVFQGLSTFTIFFGTTLFCWALVRSSVVPKSAGVLIFSGAILYGLGPMLSATVAIVGIIIFATGCLQGGVSLFKNIAR
jgi:hypothetical protein